MKAAEEYAKRVDEALAQRTRLRGEPPTSDLFGGLPPDHRLMKADARRELEPNLQAIAGYIEPDDVIVDVGGGAGRLSLPLALKCKQVTNVDPSPSMGAGFQANAANAGIENIRFVESDWPTSDPPKGTVALVNHVTYLTRDIVPFVRQLEEAGQRRVIITVNSPPPPSRHHNLFRLFYGEDEKMVAGHVELINVLWEMGILPEVRVLAAGLPPPAAPNMNAAIETFVTGLVSEQWAIWPPGPDLERRIREFLVAHPELFRSENGQVVPSDWFAAGREILITWQPGVDYQ